MSSDPVNVACNPGVDDGVSGGGDGGFSVAVVMGLVVVVLTLAMGYLVYTPG